MPLPWHCCGVKMLRLTLKLLQQLKSHYFPCHSGNNIIIIGNNQRRCGNNIKVNSCCNCIYDCCYTANMCKCRYILVYICTSAVIFKCKCRYVSYKYIMCMLAFNGKCLQSPTNILMSACWCMQAVM